MRHITIICAAVLLASTPVSRSQPTSSLPATRPATTSVGAATTAPAAAANAAEIRALVRQLSDDDWQTRQDAQEKLVRFGPEARPLLEELVRQTSDAEARTRAESALQQIEENQTTGPSIVTIRVKDAPPQQVIEDLARQAFTALPVWPDNLWKQRAWNPITVDVERQPFWVALREVCEKAGLRPMHMGQDRRFVLMQGGDDQFMGPAVYPGPFMVVANSITRSSSVSLARGGVVGGAAAPSRSLSIQFTVFAEPKLNILGHDYTCWLSEAVDEKGNSLLRPGVRPAHNSMSPDTSPRWSVSAALAEPENMGMRIARLRGSLRAMIQARVETWEVPDVMTAAAAGAGAAAGPSQVVNGRRYTVDEVRKIGDSYSVKVTTTRQTPAPQSWDRYGRTAKVSLVDAAGRPLASRGYGGGGGDEKATYTYTFDRNTGGGGGAGVQKVGEPAKLVVEVPVEVKETEVPFEFTDLPLP